MHRILVYGDSQSWGVIPGTRERLSHPERWPGVMELELLSNGQSVRVIEDCLNGRRTLLEDPIKPGRNGLIGLEQRIEVNAPLDLVMIFLGTNDFQSMHQQDASQSAQGLVSLVDAVRRAPIEPGMPTPEIMLIAPPLIRTPRGEMAAKFANAAERADGLNEAIRAVATVSKCDFVDAAEVITTSQIDGVHLDKDQHQILGRHLAEKVAGILRRAARADLI